MTQMIIQVDSFTSKPFAGNPAGVCYLDGPAEADWMQKVAAEMNLSETAFFYRADDGFHLRWFTPTVEVSLCGHATLASAHVLFADRHVPPDKVITFITASGKLSARLVDGWVELDFPGYPPEEIPVPEGLEESLGITLRFCAMARDTLLVVAESEQAIRTARPDFGKLKKLPYHGVIITSQSTGEFDFVSRFFAPVIGIDEDPVTGFAHCILAPFWSKKLGEKSLVGFQASRRGGVVKTAVRDDRVLLSGQAVITMRGELIGAAGPKKA